MLGRAQAGANVCWADSTQDSSCQHGAGGSQSMPCAGAGSSSQGGKGAVVCPYVIILDAQECGSVPQRCPDEHVPVHVRCVHRPGRESQALLSISRGTEPELCVTLGPVPTQDKLQSSLVPGDCCLLAACSRGSPQKLLSLAQGHPQSRSHPQGIASSAGHLHGNVPWGWEAEAWL